MRKRHEVIYKGGHLLYYLILFFVFIFASLIVVIALHLADKSTIWKPDGLVQHYAAFVVTRNWIKSILLSMTGTMRNIPLYSFNLGQGADIITTINSYDLLDPVSWISILACPHNTYLAYSLMIFGKVFLTGVCFSKLSFLFTEDPCAVFCGCMTYMFSGMLVVLCFQHPNFISGFYFLPLMIYAEELYLRKKNFLPLVIIVFFAVITNYYVFYMSAVLFAGYTIFHVLRVNDFWKSFLAALRIAGFCVLGCLLAAVVLLPTSYAFFQCSRSGVVTGYSDSFLTYPMDYYKKLIQFAFVPGGMTVDFYTMTGIFPISILGFVLLFLRDTEWKKLRWMFLALLAIACIPAGGRFMNAMGYPRNLWIYGLLLLLSFTTVVMFPVLSSLKKSEVGIIVILMLVYVSYTILDKNIVCDGEMLGVGIMCITMIVVVAGGLLKNKRVFSVFAMSSTLLMVLLNITESYQYSLSTYMSLQGIKNTLASEDIELPKDEDDCFYRVEKQSLLQNTESFFDYYGTTYFWSIMPGNLYKYYDDLCLNTLAQNCNTKGLDGRSSLCGVASVRYYVCKEGGENYVPHGFLKKAECENGSIIYENPKSLPLAYSFREYIPLEEYKKMSPIAKQQAVLKGAILSVNPGGIPRIIPQDRHNELVYTLGECEGASFDGTKIDVTKKGGYITIEFNAIENSEITVFLDHLKCIEGSSSTEIYAICNEVRKSGRIFRPENNWAVFPEGISFNLGCKYKNKRYSCKIEFSDIGKFSIDKLCVQSVLCSEYDEDIDLLQDSTLKNIKMGNNSITGDISCSEDRILQFSIPDNGGWKVYIDGEEEELLSSGVIYMAVRIPPGKHTIKLLYCTPFLKVGIVISGAALLFLLLFTIKDSNSQKKKGENHG